jgi:hypothetical protein
MKREMVLQSYRETGTEATITREAPGKAPIDLEFSTEFCVLGKEHSYHFGYDFNSNTRILAIGGLNDNLEDVLKTGTLVSLGQGSDLNAGYNRTLLIERSQLGGLPLEDSIRLTEAVTNYDDLESQLGDASPESPRAPAPARQPSFQMEFRKQ